MSPTLFTATPDPATASVLLTVSPVAGAPAPPPEYEWGSWRTIGDVGINVYNQVVATAPGYFYTNVFGLDVGETYEARVVHNLGFTAGAWKLRAYQSGGYSHEAPLRPPVAPLMWRITSVRFVATHTTVQLSLMCDEPGTGAFEVNGAGLVMDGTGEAEWEQELSLLSLTRTDVAGTSDVRLQVGQDLTSGSLLVYDVEASLVGSVIYRLETQAAERELVVTFGGTVPGPELAVPVLPQWRASVDLVTKYGEEWPSSVTVHEVIDRPDPLVTMGPLGSRRGTMELWCPDYAAADHVRFLYSRGHVVHLRQSDHPGLDLYHVAGPAGVLVEPFTETRGARTRWRVTVDYLEVPRPSDPALGSPGWTFDDVTTNYGTFDGLRTAFETFDDLRVGPQP